jgi:hypothetical protein
VVHVTWNFVEETVYQEAKRAGKESEWMRRSYRRTVEFLMVFESISEDLCRLEPADSAVLTEQVVEAQART